MEIHHRRSCSTHMYTSRNLLNVRVVLQGLCAHSRSRHPSGSRVSSCAGTALGTNTDDPERRVIRIERSLGEVRATSGSPSPRLEPHDEPSPIPNWLPQCPRRTPRHTSRQPRWVGLYRTQRRTNPSQHLPADSGYPLSLTGLDLRCNSMTSDTAISPYDRARYPPFGHRSPTWTHQRQDSPRRLWTAV